MDHLASQKLVNRSRRNATNVPTPAQGYGLCITGALDMNADA